MTRSLAAGALERAIDRDGWLFRSAQNADIDHYRTRRAHQGLGDDFAEMPEPAPIDPGPNQPTRELARCVQPRIEQLPAKYRDALAAVDIHGRTHSEAAAELGLSTSGGIVDYAPSARSYAAPGCACTA